MKASVIKTSLQGKIDSLLAEHLTEISLIAAEALVDEEGGKDLERLRIKRIQISGGRALDSELLPALLLAKTKLIGNTSTFSKGGKVAIIDGGIEERKLSLDAQIEINELGALKDFQTRNEKYLKEMVNCLENLNPELSKQWHPTKNGKLTPSNVTTGYSKKVWCKCKQSYRRSIFSG